MNTFCHCIHNNILIRTTCNIQRGICSEHVPPIGTPEYRKHAVQKWKFRKSTGRIGKKMLIVRKNANFSRVANYKQRSTATGRFTKSTTKFYSITEFMEMNRTELTNEMFTC